MFGLHLARREKIIAVADIGSGSVAFAILSTSSTSSEVLAAERSILPLEERSREATIAALGEHLAQAGKKAFAAYAAGKKKVAPITNIYCVMHAPWTHAKSMRAKAHFEKPTVITRATIAGLAQQALADEQELDHKQLLEATVVRVELNGYETSDPEKQVAQRIVISALISDCDPDMRAAVSASLSASVPHLAPRYVSSTRALLSAIRQLPEHEEDRLIVEVVSNNTTLTTVRGGTIGQQYTVPEGIYSILKRLSPTGMPEETLSLIRMVNREECSTAACQAIQDAMGKAEPELVRSFGEGMAVCAAEGKLPNTLTLLVQPDFLPWLSKFFTRIDFTQFTATTQPFLVEPLTTRELLQNVTLAPRVAIDPGLALSVALVNREENER